MNAALALIIFRDALFWAIALIFLGGAVHILRLLAGCPRSEWECIADAWSAFRRRLSPTRRHRAASGRGDQA